jgi:hypothetical protein
MKEGDLKIILTKIMSLSTSLTPGWTIVVRFPVGKGHLISTKTSGQLLRPTKPPVDVICSLFNDAFPTHNQIR